MDTSALARNRTALKKCAKVYNIVTAVYVISCVAYIAAELYMILLPFDTDPFYLLMNGPVFKGAVLTAGFLGTYKKSTLFAGLAPMIMLINLILYWNADNFFDLFFGVVMPMKIDLVYTIVMIVLGVATMLANAKYHYLEEQEGFPQFSELFEEQKKRGPVNAMSYEERAEQLRRAARPESARQTMDELDM